jgi:vacuolar-type H+-ATPase subunit C/Vma6
MSQSEYSTRRLRALQEGLLAQEALDTLRQSDSVDVLLDELDRTPYAGALRRARMTHAGVRAVAEACRQRAAGAYAEVSSLHDADAQRLLDVVAARLDIHNLRTIFRGQASNRPIEDVCGELIPAGFLTDPALRALASEPRPTAAASRLASIHAAYGRAAREALATAASANDWNAGETVLETRLYLALLGRASRGTENDRLVVDLLMREIDVRNITAALAQRATRRNVDARMLELWFIPLGHATLAQLCSIVTTAEERELRRTLREIETTAGALVFSSAAARAAVQTNHERFMRALAGNDQSTIAPAIAYVESVRFEAAEIAAIARQISAGPPRDRMAERIREVG